MYPFLQITLNQYHTICIHRFRLYRKTAARHDTSILKTSRAMRLLKESAAEKEACIRIYEHVAVKGYELIGRGDMQLSVT